MVYIAVLNKKDQVYKKEL